ncbi:MAG: FxsA family protein [Epsilonproteobacteria bacterium]|nr:FxsA family protein [Campylobacterota bacterium]
MIYFLVYLFLEVMVSVNIASSIGGFTTFLEILLSAFLGIVILINFKEVLFENMKAVSYSCINLEEFQQLNLFTVIGAFLLIIPGFLTDIIGLLLQFSAITSMIVNRYNVQSKHCKTHTKDADVIDVEVIKCDTTSK